MLKNKAISRTNKKVIINIEEARKLISDVELEIMLRTIKNIEQTESFMRQKAGK